MDAEMNNNQSVIFLFNTLQSWLITLSVIFVALFGVILSLVCIYALPSETSRPQLGAFFFIGSSITIVFLVFIAWKKEARDSLGGIGHSAGSELERTTIQESVSEKIIKWIVTLFSLFFVFDSVAISLICIYALPDHTAQPTTGAIYFFCGAFVVVSFVYTVWKRKGGARQEA